MNYNRYINILLILFAFAFPISIAAANIILGIMLVLWILEGDFKNKLSKIKKNDIFIIFALIVFTLFISTLFSPEYNQGFQINNRIDNQFEFLKRFVWIGSFYIIYITSAQKNTAIKMVNSFLIAMFINELISYSIYFKIIDKKLLLTLKDMHLMHKLASSINPSPMNHSFYSLYLALTIILLLYKLLNSKNSIYLKIGMFFFTLSALTNLFINAGRTGQLAIILGLIVFFITYIKNKKALFLIIIITLIIPIIAYKMSPNFKRRVDTSLYTYKLIQKNNYCSSWGERVGMVKTSFDYLTANAKNFILGAGNGIAKREYLNFTKQHYPNIYKCIKHERTLHNQYLQLWIDGGIFALILMLYLLNALLKKNRQNFYLNSALVTIFAFSFISDVMIYYSKTLILFLFILIVIQYYKEGNYEKI